MVFFRRSDVIAAGDVYSTVSYPMIDLTRGGSITGVLAGLNQLLDLVVSGEKTEGGTMIVPGHGRISDEADLVEYRDMTTIIRDRVQDMVNRGHDAGAGAGRPADDGVRRPLRQRARLVGGAVRRGGVPRTHTRGHAAFGAQR